MGRTATGDEVHDLGVGVQLNQVIDVGRCELAQDETFGLQQDAHQVLPPHPRASETTAGSTPDSSA